MSMVFCRGCGKEIHETAATCPSCGAPQNIPNSGKISLFFLLLIMAFGSLPLSTATAQGRSQETGRSQRSQTQERGGNIDNISEVQTLIDAKNYIRSIGVDITGNLISCKGRQQFAFNEWRENFASCKFSRDEILVYTNIKSL